MVHISETLNCCGVVDIQLNEDWDGAVAALREIYENWEYHPIAVLSEHQHRRNASKLIKLIKRYDLGNVVGTPRMKNPNSGNFIRTYLWAVDKEKFAALAKKRGWWNNTWNTNYDRFGTIKPYYEDGN